MKRVLFVTSLFAISSGLWQLNFLMVIHTLNLFWIWFVYPYRFVLMNWHAGFNDLAALVVTGMFYYYSSWALSDATFYWWGKAIITAVLVWILINLVFILAHIIFEICFRCCPRCCKRIR